MALVLSLFLMTVLSVLAASMMFLSQTETYASQNYKSMSQARYGAESGIHNAVNYLLNNYAPPGTVKTFHQLRLLWSGQADMNVPPPGRHGQMLGPFHQGSTSLIDTASP